ncbi:MAG TPA: ribosome small subunit-dependent GTPase A [Candidatus Hydrogenedentes bacterium]|nr:ribosome small subunit-dependent GTPase A [Candidatus Hydrogenedentota bacterium]
MSIPHDESFGDDSVPVCPALAALGWDARWAGRMEPYLGRGWEPARVVCEHRGAYVAAGASGELWAELSGRFRHEHPARAEWPAVGDWVMVSPRAEEGAATVQAVLPRRSRFSRTAAGDRTEEQVVAANVDVVFLVTSLDGDFNLRRIERFLAVTRESGAEPVILLNKADLLDNADEIAAEVTAIAGDAAVIPISAETGTGFRKLSRWLKKGRTIALLGSSGVGKSTIANRIMRDEVQVTAEVREKDSKGRHTTTRRELFVAPSGAMLIDTPGMRELQLWSADVGKAFADVTALAAQCKFSNCRHGSEAGCAIQAALASGALPAERWQSYLKLLVEQETMAARLHARREQPKKIAWRKAAKESRVRPRITADHD